MPLELYQSGMCSEMPGSLPTHTPTTSCRLRIRAQVKAPTFVILISLWSLTDRVYSHRGYLCNMSEVQSHKQPLTHPQIHFVQYRRRDVLHPQPAFTHTGKCRLCMEVLESQRIVKHPSNRTGDSGAWGREREKR